MEPRCAGHSSQTCSPLRPGRSPGHRLTRAWHLAWHIDARMPSRTLTPNHVGTRVSCWSNEVYTSALWLESGSPQSSSYRYSRTGELRKTKSESLATALPIPDVQSTRRAAAWLRKGHRLPRAWPWARRPCRLPSGIGSCSVCRLASLPRSTAAHRACMRFKSTASNSGARQQTYDRCSARAASQRRLPKLATGCASSSQPPAERLGFREQQHTARSARRRGTQWVR